MEDNSIQTEVSKVQDAIHSLNENPTVPTPLTPTPVKAIRTFQGDMQEHISKNNDSVVSIAVAEEKAREKTATSPATSPLNTFDEDKPNILLTYGVLPLIGIVLFIGGAILVAVVYYRAQTNSTPVSVTLHTTLIPYSTKIDEVVTVDNLRNQITTSFSQHMKTYSQSLGSVLYIHFLGQQLGTDGKTLVQNDFRGSDFFSVLAITAPNTLKRSLGDEYMVGIYSSETNTPFMILSTDDYGQTYAGMLSWEATMSDDLGDIFTGLPQMSVASSSPTWTDKTFNNRNVRVLTDANGATILMYGFFNRNTLAITTNEKIFQTLVSKYTNAKLVH